MAAASESDAKLLELLKLPQDEEEVDGFLFSQMAWSIVVPMALRTTIELGVFDIIAKEGKGAKLSAKDIVDHIGTNNPEAASMLDRLLRLLASHSLLSCSVVEDPESSNNLHHRLYSLSPVSKYFVGDADGVSLGPSLLLHLDQVFTQSWLVVLDTGVGQAMTIVFSNNVVGVEHMGGDMFESVPNADAIFMKTILHDWGDEECLKILKNCLKAIPNDGKVIVVETMVSIFPEPTSFAENAFRNDVIMMTQMLGGIERTKQDFMDLANGSGFSGIRFVCCVSSFWVMEFYK
ncbi:anthranilate N-methyltransferase-like [Arachis ipaensis]|uniref:anthranilate N-methyltransferase-like n=1 Tax=Arachis ipaensis TaxID=130454 RepID=UPI000A2B0CB9|nr:anthranilate N-methyltransferase-like [Arachis ipaensis]